MMATKTLLTLGLFLAVLGTGVVATPSVVQANPTTLKNVHQVRHFWGPHRNRPSPKRFFHRKHHRHWRHHHHYPKVGLRIRVLPFGFVRVLIGGRHYYYCDGVYYRPYGRGFTVVKVPS